MIRWQENTDFAPPNVLFSRQLSGIQLYVAFILPGLEYGLTLAWDGPLVISLLQNCQKRLLCGFLGINFIARNDLVHLVTGCLPIQIRSELFTHLNVY